MSDMADFVIEHGVLKKHTNCFVSEIVVPDGVTAIGRAAFERHYMAAKIVLPDSVRVIDASAFSQCTRLVEVKIPKGVNKLGSGAFSGCNSLTEVILPPGMTEIPERLFEGCSSLKTLEIPGRVTKIGASAFSKCSSLGQLQLPDGVCAIGIDAFKGCSALESMVIPEGVTVIARGAFGDCARLKEIRLPENLTEIGDYAFQRSGIQNIGIPAGVTQIGEFAFTLCDKLTQLKLPKQVLFEKKITSWNSEALRAAVLPAGQNAICGIQYSFCASLEEVQIPEGCNVIWDNAFCGCSSLQRITIPDGVTAIGDKAFKNCKNLEEIVIPDSVAVIGKYAFNGCDALADEKGLVIVRNTLYGYVGSGDTLEIPAEVSIIEDGALSGCGELKNISFGNPKCELKGDVFGPVFPKTLYGCAHILYPRMSDAQLKKYLVNKTAWPNLEAQLQVEIYMATQGKALAKDYAACITPKKREAFATGILEQLEGKPGVKACGSAVAFMNQFYKDLSDGLLRNLHDRLKQIKNAAKALKKLEDNPELMERLGKELTIEEDLKPAEKLIMQNLLEEKKTAKDLAAKLKERFGISFADLPELWYPDGSKTEPYVLAWLLMASMDMTGNTGTEKADTPGLSEKVKRVLSELNPARVQRAMLALACANLGITGRSKKMYLAYPICRYANEELMADLCAKAPKWRSQVSGNDAPPLYSFRMACLYSETRAAMLFADRFGDLDKYAEIRGTDADTIRDKYLSDVGLDEKGGKFYDLGNQTVTVRLQKDLSFLVELPTGKTAKSLPKKGADAEKFAVANADFSELKKNVKKIAKNRVNILFADFLSGRARPADAWKESTLNNPLLRQVAGLLVWAQDGKTFTLTDAGAITANGNAYAIGDAEIVLAHPMDMSQTDLDAWQKYFTANGIRQPFEQIWEPVVDAVSVTEDRYKDCMIPYHRFAGQKKHGIHVEDADFHNSIYIYFDDCKADVKRIDQMRHAIEMDHRFEVRSISFEKFTRRVNHIIAYLDRATIVERIKKDDVGIAAFLPSFTLSQITEFIKVATENNCTNVAAVLLDYKNKNFEAFDPMAEFTLDL